MQGVVEELSNRIALTLADLAFNRGYRIHPGVGMASFQGAFSESGFDVINTDNKVIFGRRFAYPILQHGNHVRKVDYMSSELSYDEISQPSNYTMPNSLDAYKEAMNLAFGRIRGIGDGIRPLVWETQDEKLRGIVGRRLFGHLNEHFKRYHEHVLVSVDGDVDLLERPTIINELIHDEGLEPLENIAIRMVHDKDNRHETKERFDCEMRKYIGKYLSRLSERKGYEPTDMDTRDPEMFFTERQISGFKEAMYLNWRLHPS